MDWIIENIGTLIIGLVVALVIALIIVKLVRDKRKGKNLGCDCGCDGCSTAESSCCAPSDLSKQIEQLEQGRK